MELNLYREVRERIQEDGADVVINLTTGPGQRFFPDTKDPKLPDRETTLTTPEIRVRHAVALKPELCSLNVAAMV